MENLACVIKLSFNCFFFSSFPVVLKQFYITSASDCLTGRVVIVDSNGQEARHVRDGEPALDGKIHARNLLIQLCG